MLSQRKAGTKCIGYQDFKMFAGGGTKLWLIYATRLCHLMVDTCRKTPDCSCFTVRALEKVTWYRSQYKRSESCHNLSS